MTSIDRNGISGRRPSLDRFFVTRTGGPLGNASMSWGSFSRRPEV